MDMTGSGRSLHATDVRAVPDKYTVCASRGVRVLTFTPGHPAGDYLQGSYGVLAALSSGSAEQSAPTIRCDFPSPKDIDMMRWTRTFFLNRESNIVNES